MGGLFFNANACKIPSSSQLIAMHTSILDKYGITVSADK
jgi:hypothetical protein